MKNQMTKKTIVMLGILVVLLLGVCYYKLIYTPIQEGIAAAQSQQDAEQVEVDTNMAKVAEMNRMQAVIDEAKKSGIGNAIPPYDNGQRLMKELYPILATTKDYSVAFQDKEFQGYLALFPVNMEYKTTTYAESRKVIDKIAAGSVNQIGNVSIRLGDATRDDMVSTELGITYFEVVE